MWFSAIPCLMCITIGSIVSFACKPQDPKSLNPDLISPMLPKLFSWWPLVGRKIDHWYKTDLSLGVEYVSSFEYPRVCFTWSSIYEL